MTRLGFWILFLLVMGTACDSQVGWYNSPPVALHGVWIERSDAVLSGIELPDTIHVKPNALILSRYETDGSPWRSVCSPIRRVSQRGHKYVVFCGETSEEHIAETRIEMKLNETLDQAVVDEVVATGINHDHAFFSMGRFEKERSE